ncbi:DUF2169 family type VI secretion system accessory protein [Sphaerotilaceae bacterium SBD11-9]
MRFTNQTGLPAGWTLGFEPDGREMIVVMAKATYTLPSPGEQPELAPEQQALVEADEFTGEPGLSAPRHETDYAHRKPGCDVLLLGSAHAPPGQQVPRVLVGLKVADMVKQFAVVGQRRWRRQLVGVSASPPEPFTTMPISYDTAFGGTDCTREDAPVTYRPNPVGAGYWRHTDRIDDQPLPTSEEHDVPVVAHDVEYRPMSFSPIGRNWTPRAAYAGTYDQQWIENTAPLWPADFDPRYFQAAPPDQVIPYPQGGEPVVLRNLTADNQRAFQLPVHRMPVVFIPHKGRDVNLDARIDTLVFEPDQNRFTMTWRANLPLGRSIFDVKETIVGEMPAAWHRARRFPGKTYYPGLAALVQARKRPR